MGPRREPQHLSQALSELIALRGLARSQGNRQLADAWSSVAGPKIAASTKPGPIRRGILQIAVPNSSLLSELATFHKPSLLARLKSEHPELKIKDLKFRLQGNLKES